MTGHTYSQPLNVSQRSFVNANLSDLDRLGDDTLSTDAINERCSKMSWKQAFHADVIERVPDASGNKYRVKPVVQGFVAGAEYATLPCGCTGFETTAEGYECDCGETHERATVEAYLEQVP